MKKRHCAVLLAFGILWAGCGAKDALPSAEWEKPETETVLAGTGTEEAESLSAVRDAGYGISITGQKKSPFYYSKKDPSVLVLEASAAYPKIEIEGNAAASDKINAVISSELDTFLNFEKENASNAEEEYLTSLDFSDASFTAYRADFSYLLKRCDDSIISIVFSQDDFTGGAHGSHWSYGVTFDTATGERIYLENLGADYTAFRQMLSDNLNAQANLPAYENFISTDTSPDINTALLSNSTSWYLDRSGLTFISNPYVLGSYAAGIFEFNIPYKDLDGLKDAYAYKGSYICKIFPGVPAQRDLCGSGTDDEICYSVLPKEDSLENAVPSLIINGTDFSEELSELRLSHPQTGAYFLVDIDPEDSLTEIAVSNENPEHPSEACTHFFRYEKDRLTYLGNTSGIFSEDMQVRYNSNGNLILLDRNGAPFTP